MSALVVFVTAHSAELLAALASMLAAVSALVALLPAGAFKNKAVQALAFVSFLTSKHVPGTLKAPLTAGPLPPEASGDEVIR